MHTYMADPEVMTAILVYSLASAVGQNFIYYTLTAFDPLVIRDHRHRIA